VRVGLSMIRVFDPDMKFRCDMFKAGKIKDFRLLASPESGFIYI